MIIQKRNKSDRQIAISQLFETITDLQSRLPLTQAEDSILTESRKELDELITLDAKGSIFRSKVQWYEFGEKSNKYFYSLEKSRYNAKTCFNLFDENNELISDQNKIINMQKWLLSGLI